VSSLAVIALALGVTYVATRTVDGEPSVTPVKKERTQRPAAAKVAPPAPSAVVTPAPDQATGTTPEMIVWRIESTPSGGEVSVDGEVRGTTPLDLSLLPDSKPAWVEVRHKGFVTSRQNVARTKSRTIAVELKKRKLEKGGGGGGGAASGKVDDGFHRFD
jgi:hypothetical protein